MIRIYILATLLIAFSRDVIAQNNDATAYKFSSVIVEDLRKDTTPWGLQTAAYSFSFIGKYSAALIECDKELSGAALLSDAKKTAFKNNYRAVDARQYIIEQASKNQIIIFNEAHYNARHRIFVTSLLHDLKKAGFTYFAAETFANNSSFATMKHPSFQTGYYTREPAFGNLVREAEKLDFNLYPYEVTSNIDGREREISQARSLANLFKKDPAAKVIIYCGFGHIWEDTLPNWGKAMAGRLKEFTGIDPYTINQVELSEHSTKALENPCYNLIYATDYSIMVDKNNKAFGNQGVDAFLYTPRTKIICNRPGWIFENGKAPYIIPAKDFKLTFPVLIKAYWENDDPKTSIPIDVIEMDSLSVASTTALALPVKGAFKFDIINLQGNTQQLKMVR